MATGELVVDVSQDWMLACDVQQRFMQGPGRTFLCLDYSAQCRQVRALGGDCYDFTPLAEDRMAFMIGDASGKGLAAALMMANVQSSLRAAALFTRNDLATLLKVVNQLAYTSSLEDRYATLFYGVFDPAARTLRYVNAGHNPPAVLRQDSSVYWLETGGAPVGMFADSSYEEGMVKLGPGDLVIAYTDGIVETTNPSGAEWGVEGLLQAIVSRPQYAMDADGLTRLILKAMNEFSEGNQGDDATLAVVRVR
jgi:sigma-B regulation protein RsbU (phosphoserine phosphatase)